MVNELTYVNGNQNDSDIRNGKTDAFTDDAS